MGETARREERPLRPAVGRAVPPLPMQILAATRAGKAEIDRLVYALCGRTEAEIGVVEG